MKLLVCPVSGGSFVHQIASIQHLTKIDYRPDSCLCSSGGNVAVHIAEASMWNPYVMSRLASRITSAFVMKKHSDNTAFSYLKTLLTGTLYKTGDGVKEFFESYIDNIEVRTEIWVGVYNKTLERKEQVCCIKPRVLNCCDDSCDALAVCGRKDFYKFCQASASIPLVVPPVVIGNYSYQDGGVSCASPLIQFSEQLLSHEDSIQMIYITPINPLYTKANSTKNMINRFMDTVDDMIRSSIKNDEAIAKSIIRSRLGSKCKMSEGRNVPLRELNRLHKEGADYLLLLYPSEELAVNISSIKSDDVTSMIEKCYSKVMYELWS